DWRECLSRYDGPETFFFLDPPYTYSNPKMYAGWTAEEMAAFATAVARLKARWVVTVNDSVDNRKLFERFHVRALSRANMIENRPGRKLKPLYRELLVSSDPLATKASAAP
ncbi:MAG: DNA adenine methylase, partial [Verrucomicrobia bacterium]|nr:DNA adenine methylase [Verrucomicrobiota bacterium]